MATTTQPQLWNPLDHDPSGTATFPKDWHPLIHDPRYLRVRAIPTLHTSTLILTSPSAIPPNDLQSLVAPLRAKGHSNHIAFIFPYLSNNNLEKDTELLRTIIDEEVVKGVKAERIAVGGIGDGFDAALVSVLGGETKIAGVVGVVDGERVGNLKGVLEKERKGTNALSPVLGVDRTGGEGGKVLEGLGQPVGAWVVEKGGKLKDGEVVSEKEIEYLDGFIEKLLPVGQVEKN